MATDARLPDADTVQETVVVGDRVLSVARPRAGEARLGEEAYGDEIVLPYWAEMWPSGVELAHALAGRALRGKRTLELGCGGLALPSIAAALAGGRVLATDWSVDAMAFVARNARRNRAWVETAVCSWTEPDLIESRAPWDLVLAADVLYEQRATELITELVPRLVGTHGSAWIADPSRDHAQVFLDALADRFEIETSPTATQRVVIHRLRPRGAER